jgi:hypothetical protein
VVVIATALYVWGITYKPAYSDNRTADKAITVSALPSGQQVYTIHLTIQPVSGSPSEAEKNAPVPSSVGGPNQAWLGYQTDTAYSGKAYPGTVFHLPRNTLVTVIVHNFDSQTPLRNPFFTLVQGTVGGVEYLNGKPIHVMNPNLTSHTFTIPDWGVSVPMAGVPSGAKAGAFETMKFTFRTPNKPGVYRWQCIVPCGWGLYGFGGPMGELGYMQGQFTVT